MFQMSCESKENSRVKIMYDLLYSICILTCIILCSFRFLRVDKDVSNNILYF